MCLVVVINVRDCYNFPYSKDIPIPNNATAAILDVFHNDLTVRAVAQMSACYNAGAIFDSF